MNENKNKKIGTILGLVFVVISMIIWTVSNPFTEKIIEDINNALRKPDAKWNTIMKMSMGDGIVLYENPSPSATDFLEIFLINLSDGDNYFTQENTSSTLESVCDANDLGYATADNSEVDITHATNFVILVKVQGDAAHCKRGSDWYDTDLNCTLTWSGQGKTDAQPEHVTIYPLASMNTSSFTFLYKMFVWDNSNSGFDIDKGSDSGSEPILELAAYY